MLHAIVLFTWLLSGLYSPFFEHYLPFSKPKKGFQANLPHRILQDVQGVYHLTAAKGKAIGPDIKFMPEYQAFGWFTSKDRVEWEVEVQKTGNYQVEMVYSVDDAEAGKVFLLSSSTSKLEGKVLPSGGWETYRKMKVGKIYLSAGLQKLVFKSKTQFKAGGAILDLREIVLK